MSTAPETVMDAAELCRARDLLGYSDAVLAADLGLPPNVVTAWTSGRAKVPARAAFGAYSLIKLFFMLPEVVGYPRTGVPLVLGGLALSIGIGAVLGLLYGGGKHLRAQLRARRVA